MVTKFEIGDVVVFKSGGPKMTVTSKQTNTITGPSYLCGWFDKEDKYNCYWLCVDVITKGN